MDSNKPQLLTLENIQTAIWRVTPSNYPQNEKSLAQQMYLHGKFDALRAAMEMIKGEIDVSWKKTLKEKPRVETEVLVLLSHLNYFTAFYEDGTIPFEDSKYAWEDDDGGEIYIKQGWYCRVPVEDCDYDYDIIKLYDLPNLWMELPEF